MLRLPDRPDLLVRPWNTEPSKERLSATEALHVATTSFNLMMKEAKATRQDESWVDTLAPPALRRAAGLQSTWTGVRLPLFAARWLEATSKIDVSCRVPLFATLWKASRGRLIHSLSTYRTVAPSRRARCCTKWPSKHGCSCKVNCAYTYFILTIVHFHAQTHLHARVPFEKF